ncbi:MAG: permease [Deltaproteobacteria bacterium]|nr:permease [Deltaproteobacteria bacterium]
MKNRYSLLLMVGAFLAAYYVPWSNLLIRRSGLEAFLMLQEYAREHVLTCLIPALFIAGAISVFVSQAAVIKYFGAGAKKILSYSVASVSGTILAVCSCTVLPLFAGIYMRGGGIGPATSFLYSGPAINVLAIVLTARVLGWKLGLARAVGAVGFAFIIGLLMHFIYLKEEKARVANNLFLPEEEAKDRPLWKEVIYMATLVAILIFAAWGKPAQPVGFWMAVWEVKWFITGALLVLLVLELWFWFNRDEISNWGQSTWGFAKQILPLLFGGVLVAGFLLGRPGYEALIPEKWIQSLVGGNSLWANLFASVAGALMYFATLTEVPILQGLIGSGMGQGPALALLLAGPALSLPSMLVIRSIVGTQKMLVYSGLVVILSTFAGLAYGAVVG